MSASRPAGACSSDRRLASCAAGCPPEPIAMLPQGIRSRHKSKQTDTGPKSWDGKERRSSPAQMAEATMNLRNWKILHKILLAISALALAALAGGGYAGYKMKSIDDTYSRLIDTDSRALTLMVHDDDLTNDMGQKLWNAVAETDATLMKSLQSDFDKEAAAELAELDKGIQELPKYKDKLQKLRDMTQKLAEMAKPVFAATIANDNKTAIRLGKEFKA